MRGGPAGGSVVGSCRRETEVTSVCLRVINRIVLPARLLLLLLLPLH